MPTWRRIQERQAGYIYDLSESLALLEWRYPGLLVPVSDGVMVIASDYSGQHKGASHEAYSFLLATRRTIEEWGPVRQAFRDEWMPDSRRMSYKQLRDAVRWRALLPFLDAASMIRGNAITFLIDTRIGSFMEGGACAIAQVFPDCFPADARYGTIEKMFRVSSLLAMLIAGFRREDQESLWVSDNDETLETSDRREQFGRLSAYLSFGLTRWRSPADHQFATTGSPHAPPWSEDVAAIPDLVAGACCSVSDLLPAYCGTKLWVRVVQASDAGDRRAYSIVNWMATTRGHLRHILLRLAPDQQGAARASAQFIAGTL